MHISTIIEELCSDLLHTPGLHPQETIDNLRLSADLVQFDVTKTICDDTCLQMSLVDAVKLIRERVAFCRNETQEMVYDLLMEQGATFH